MHDQHKPDMSNGVMLCEGPYMSKAWAYPTPSTHSGMNICAEPATKHDKHFLVNDLTHPRDTGLPLAQNNWRALDPWEIGRSAATWYLRDL